MARLRTIAHRILVFAAWLMLSTVPLAAQTPLESQTEKAQEGAQPAAHGGSSTAGVFAPELDAHHLPITQGGTVKAGPIVYQDMAAKAGLTKWHHVMGTPGKRYILESIGSGVALLDYDNDGWLDIYLVNGSTQAAVDGKAMPPHAALFHNNHDGTFTDVTAKAGVGNDRWGFGVAVGDYDNDGWPDLYVTNFGKNRLINKHGQLNDLHQVWDNHVLAYNNTIQSGRSQLVRYAFTMPHTSGPVSVTAAVLYRRFDEHFIDYVMKMQEGTHYQQPIIEMASTTRTFNVGANAATKPLVDENPEWMRWNNYGIGLLDAQQYAASVNAFEQVAKLRPEYADAPTNIAIAYIQWEKYNDAVPHLEQSLALAKDNARALYYLALVERNQGKVDEAIANLQKVEAQFPRSVDVHRELGFSFYQEHQYNLARTEYESVQSIEPDDLAAHYNLAILYRRLGLKAKASLEAAAFADEKDDPTASTFALEYLRKHHEAAQESIPWHVHELDVRSESEHQPAVRPVATAPPGAQASQGGAGTADRR